MNIIIRIEARPDRPTEGDDATVMHWSIPNLNQKADRHILITFIDEAIKRFLWVCNLDGGRFQ